MKQLISDLRFFTGDSANLTPANNILSYKGVIDNPRLINSGVVVIDGISFNKFEMKQVNYAVIIAKHPVSIIIDKKLIIYSNQFIISNKNTTIDISIYPRLRHRVEVQYIYGFINPGGLRTDGSIISAVEIPEGCCDEEYDEYLKNLIIDTDGCDFVPDMAQFTDNPDCCNHCTYDAFLNDIIFKED